MTSNKVYLSWKDIENHVNNLAVTLYRDDWRPDLIVGIHSGGGFPATMLAKMLDVPSHILDVRLRDTTVVGPESCCWLAEDAYNFKKILVVDDINDSGATINWIKNDWTASCLPNDPRWFKIWGDSVRFAVIINNEASDADINYSSSTINKVEDNKWIVFPWEEFWKR